MLGASVSTELVPDDVSMGPPIAFHHMNRYLFDFDGVEKTVSRSTMMYVDLHYVPGVRLIRIVIPAAQLEDGNKFRTVDGQIEISVVGETRPAFDKEHGFHDVFKIQYLRVDLKTYEPFLQFVHLHEYHKVVIRINLMTRQDMMKVRTTYLGRPQKITTTGKNRSFTWISGEKKFEGVGQPSMEDLFDHMMLQKNLPISPRQYEYVHDHDEFSNPNKCLPIFVEQDQNLILQVFNLKFTPPSFAEFKFTWAEFDTAAHGCYNTRRDAFTFSIEFLCEDKRLKITSIAMKVKEYRKVLRLLGRNEVGHTI